MKYIIGLVLGLVTGIFLYRIWNKIFGRYLPSEDSFLLKFICGSMYVISGLIIGILFSIWNFITIGIGFFILILLIIVTYAFGFYYKVVASKRVNF